MRTKNTTKKIVQGSVTLILFILIFFMMHSVHDIQGTARVVNYAGLVRGATQRMIKLEIAGIESTEKIEELDEYVDGIRNGSKSLDLVKIEESEYQDKVAKLCEAWEILKEEIQTVREYGYQNTEIVKLSEAYFNLSDEVVGLAEDYSQKCATNIRNLESMIVFLILFLVWIMLKQSIDAIKFIRMNRELKKKVFWDGQTKLPNKNKCAEILADASFIEAPTTFFMFDLNNLKYVNDNMGHEMGDTLICNFAKLIREGIPEAYFVGRYGGDEFIAILSGEGKPEADDIVKTVQEKVDNFNQRGDGIPISYAVGYANSSEFEACTLRILLSKADANMYENKKITKKNSEEIEKKLDYSLIQMMQALGNAYKDGFYCNAQSGKFRIFKQKEQGVRPTTGMFQDEMERFIQTCIQQNEQERIRKMLSMSYIKEHINKGTTSYNINCKIEDEGYEIWWRITVMYIDSNDIGELLHFLVLFEEISAEVELEYEAKHDGLTRLWNKTTAFSMIESIMRRKKNNNDMMLVIDIDNFKQVNDELGHSVGDQVLVETAHIIQSHFRKDDIVARFGGDEFFVFISEVKSIEVINNKAQDILDEITKYFRKRYPEIEITLSIGIATAQNDITPENLFYEADQALYKAKKSGKNRVVWTTILG